MRITGLATGLDMDQLVKETMQPYRIRIQQQQQKKEIVEIKQKLYREVINEARGLYNKYFDITKSNSILLNKNWTTTGFTSSNENNVSVTASADAKPKVYNITGTAAAAATATVENIDTVVINGKEFTTTGATSKDKATDLSNKLKEAGMNVTVRYTDLAGTIAGNKSGFIFESTVLGQDNTFTLGGGTTTIGSKTNGMDATAATISGFTTAELKAVSGQFKIGGTTIDLGDISINTDEEIKTLLNNKVSSSGLTADISGGNVTFTTKSLGSSVVNPNIDIGGNTGVFTSGTDATKSSNTVVAADISGEIIAVNGKTVDLSKAAGNEVDYLNTVLKSQNAGVTATLSGTDIVFTSDIAGANKTVDINLIDTSGGGFVPVTAGSDAAIVIKDDKGGVYTHTGNSNTVTLDGVTFKFNGAITGQVTVNGKLDTNSVKDNIVNFINDYNKLMEKFNTLTMEQKNRSFIPLTDEQKKEMSDDEIKLWNEKVQKGQLSKDSDLTRIKDKMKSIMGSMIDGNTLEGFGIKSVADYKGVLNGTFTVDESKLSKALENNPEEVMNLFISVKEDNNRSGLAQQLKTLMYNETVTTKSSLIKKAGIEGSATVTDNQLTENIKQYESKMKDMEKDFTRREQALYSKWARIESMMNKLNSQQSYFMSQFGGQ